MTWIFIFGLAFLAMHFAQAQTWSEQAYIKASNTDANDVFGHSLATAGDTIVVGARREASSSTGVGGNQADNSASSAGAAYVLVRDGSGNWMQQAYIKASNTDAGDSFGYSVAVSGDTLVVGAPLEDSGAVGVNGNQADNSANDAGAVYVFTRDGSGTWSQQAYLKASNTDGGDEFGHSVAISGDTVVVGARAEDSSATGVDGSQADNSASDAGAAYVFTRDGSGTWSQQAYLKASNTDAGDGFGNSIEISSDTVVVGAPFEDSSATGVDDDESDNSASSAGAAYVFVRDGSGSWSQQAYLKASNTDAVDQFASTVAVSGDVVVVGAFREASNATGVDGNQADNSAGGAGAAYLYVRDGAGNWVQEAYLKASNTDPADEFGRSVSVSDNTVVVGARQENSNATGVDGNQADNSASNAGAAYVFVPDGAGSWLQQAYLKASNTDSVDQFGGAVAISGDTVVAGARLEDSNATGVDGNQADNSSSGSGAAYAFVVAQFSVGGTVSGLAGQGLVVQNNGGGDQAITADGPFSFPPQNDGTPYEVTVLSQPDGPSQTCTVTNGNGTFNGADVTNVEISCITDQFTVGGTVSGLSGSGLVLQNNAGDDQAIVSNGPFTFSPQDDETNYEVTVLTQPSGPIQTCDVDNGSGTLAGDDVTDVVVNCVDEPPELTLSSSSIDFGVVDIGTTALETLTVTNTGTGDLVINGISGPLAPFSIGGGSCVPLPLTLLPGEACTIEVSFSPYSAGNSVAGNFDILSNADPASETVSLGGMVPAIPVPTFSSTGMILLVLILAMLGWRASGRQQARCL